MENGRFVRDVVVVFFFIVCHCGQKGCDDVVLRPIYVYTIGGMNERILCSSSSFFGPSIIELIEERPRSLSCPWI